MPGKGRHRRRHAKRSRSGASRHAIRTRRERRLSRVKAAFPARSWLPGPVSLRGGPVSACRGAARPADGGRRPQHDDRRDGPIRLQRTPGRPFQPVRLQAWPRERHLRSAPAGPARHAYPARRRTESSGAAADHARWCHHRHRARRKRRGCSRHAGARASLRHAERAAHAATGRERPDRRPRRLSHLRAAARRVHRVRHTA